MAHAVLLLALLAAAGVVCAETIGFGVNSRGNSTDSQQVNALWRINLLDGEVDYVGWTGYLDLEAIALDPEGTLYGADDESKTLVRVSQVTGLAIPVGGVANRSNMGQSLLQGMDFGMDFDCHGTAWVVSDVQQSLFQADMETGRLTRIGERGSLGAPITDIAIRGRHVYGIGVGLSGSGAVAAPNLYRVDLENASAELIGPLGPEVSPYNNAGLAFDAAGTLWAITDRRATPAGDFPSQILRIDRDTGIAEKVAETIVGVESLAITTPAACDADDERGMPMVPASVPVLTPPWLGLLILLMLGLGLVQAGLRRS
ncbi:MAG: hypothetical protein EA370_17050 [Wenzhouxiangella sp.]|nr:MAG: hypothetical protein EA370_17050 [Wenzhouxiangella sp.]